jgi:hypothetical protein
LLGGVFAAASLAGKGPGRFASGRLLRLGVPLLLYVTLINPLANFLGDLAQGMRPELWPYLAPGSEDHDAGPLWFVAALLTSSLAYAAWRWWRPAGGGNANRVAMRPRQLLLAAAVIAVGSLQVPSPLRDGRCLPSSSLPLSLAHHTGTETGVPSRLKVVMLTKHSLANAAQPTFMNFLLDRC